jgi:uncharacterized protein (DUF433 family)
MNVHMLPAREAIPTSSECARGLLSLREVVTLAEIPEKRVRKDIETGVLESPNVWRLKDSRLCFPWESVFPLAAVYSNRFLSGSMRKSALNLVYHQAHSNHWGRRHVIDAHCVFTMSHTLPCDMPKSVSIDRYIQLNLAEVCENLFPKVSLYMSGLLTVEERSDILGGEAVFKDTRLSVLHVGKMVENGELVENIIEDYPYLTSRDVEFAVIYSRAHPPVGRPRSEEESGDDAETSAG